jgi:hypothetical protein
MNVIIPDSVTTIEEFAFRNCSALTGISIGNNRAKIGQHAFYGCNALTIYCESETIPADWALRWNSSFRPVVLGCTLTEDNAYVVSFVLGEENILNADELILVTAPAGKVGFVCVGWTTVQDGTTVEYTCDGVVNAPVGTKLYPVWTKYVPQPDVTPES